MNTMRIMKTGTTKTVQVTLSGLLAALVMSLTMLVGAQAVFAQEKSSPLVRANPNWPSDQEARALLDELYYQRAIHSYILTLRALNTIALRDGSEAAFGKGYHKVTTWHKRMGPKTWAPTPNADIMYNMWYADLKETGPLVVAAPPRTIAMVTDFFQNTLTDIGRAGPDRGDGGLYLILPPDYQGFVPDGYWAFKSSTYNIFLFFRFVLDQGPDGPDTSKAIAQAARARTYPLWELERDIPPMEFHDASDVRLNHMYPHDFAFWEKLKAFIDYEPLEAFSAQTRGVLASIGIIKGEPFKPTPKQRELLQKAVKVAPKMVLAYRKLGRPDGRYKYYDDRQYINVWAGGTAEFMQQKYLDIDMRAAFFQLAYSSAPAMVRRAIRSGSKYPVAFRDGNGEILSGSNQYKMHLPAGVPARLYWAVTIYNVADGTMPAETSQKLPTRNSLDKLVQNEDGSFDIYFGPELPNGAPEKNWIQTVDGRDFFLILRLYGSDIEFFDQTWKPDDVVKLK